MLEWQKSRQIVEKTYEEEETKRTGTVYLLQELLHAEKSPKYSQLLELIQTKKKMKIFYNHYGYF